MLVIIDNVAPVLTTTQLVETALFTTTINVLSGEVSDGSMAFDQPINVSVLVQEPDGALIYEPATQNGTAWHFDLSPLMTGQFTLWVYVSDQAGNIMMNGPYQLVMEPYQPVVIERRVVFLPALFREFVAAPDIVLERFSVSESSVAVVLKNAGTSSVTESFWVDLYVDPDPVPTGVNQIWQNLASQGMVWGVTTSLAVGEVVTLTQGDSYYRGEYSRITWPLSVGRPVYVQVDSADATTNYGGVLELHEITGGAYNNITGSTVVAGAVGLTGGALRVQGVDTVPPDLGLRPRPVRERSR